MSRPLRGLPCTWGHGNAHSLRYRLCSQLINCLFSPSSSAVLGQRHLAEICSCRALVFNFLLIRGFNSKTAPGQASSNSPAAGAKTSLQVGSSPGFSGHPTSSSPAVKVRGDSGRAALVGGLQRGGLGQSSPLPAALGHPLLPRPRQGRHKLPGKSTKRERRTF